MKQIIRSILLALVLLACGDYPDKGSSDGLETGTAEQPIWSNGTGSFIHGTCETRQRQKCSYVAACPSNARCIVPATKLLKVAMVGDDFEQFGTSWKYEIRRLLGPTAVSSGDIRIVTDNDWAADETTVANANLVITRSTCSCVTAACDTPVDFTCFQEPVGTAAQILSESFPGVYARPGSATVKRYMFLNVSRMLEIRNLYALTDSEYHFLVEHTVRWGIWSILGVGAYTLNQPPVFPNAYSDFFVMRSTLSNSVTGYNYNNRPENWEICMMKAYTLVNLYQYQGAPVGCTDDPN